MSQGPTTAIEPPLDELELLDPPLDELELLEPPLDELELLEPPLDELELLEPPLDELELLEPPLDELALLEPPLDELELLPLLELPAPFGSPASDDPQTQLPYLAPSSAHVWPPAHPPTPTQAIAIPGAQTCDEPESPSVEFSPTVKSPSKVVHPTRTAETPNVAMTPRPDGNTARTLTAPPWARNERPTGPRREGKTGISSRADRSKPARGARPGRRRSSSRTARRRADARS
jgi:hypothetical protein